MKLSKFNLWVKDYPSCGEHLLFNTRTQALIKVTNEFKHALHNCAQASIADTQIKNNLIALKKNGIIVEDEQEEKSKLEDFFRQLKYASNGLAFEATILTTYNCNFKCVYCFEEQVKENKLLDQQTADLIVNWIIERVKTRNLKRIFLVYYGGEPLLNTAPIYDISRKLQDWSKAKGIDFGFAIITNGSLISPEMIDKMLSLGLRQVRITVDGNKEAHDQKRPFSDGRPTFDVIINNIKSIIYKKVDVAIAGNFDRESFTSISKLLDYLEQEKLLHRLKGIGFAPLVPRLGPKDNPAGIELSEYISYAGKDGLFAETISIKRELMRRGVKILTGLAINACPLFMQDAGVTIDPEGVIYKCNSLVGHAEFSVGDVRWKEFHPRADYFLNINAWERCSDDCPFVPMCQGGCRFFSYVENNNFYDLSCKREYLEAIIPDLIKLEYENQKSLYSAAVTL